MGCARSAPRPGQGSGARSACGVFAGALLAAPPAFAAGSPDIAQSFLWIALLLLAAKIGTLVERLGQPAVLGEILAGIAIGNLVLVGVDAFAAVPEHPVVRFLAELGAVILLFQLGLESSVRSMRRVGGRALAVAMIGVAAPFVLGTYVVGPVLLPGLSQNAYLFIGAALTATSVGITGRVFRDLGCLGRPEAQIVLGAAVIDDVLGLIILSVVSSIAASGAVTAGEIAGISLQATAFLAGALVFGQLAAPHLSRAFSRIHRGHGMKLTVALGLCLVFAWIAHSIGLAPIVGAFAAGLVLEEVHFKYFEAPSIERELGVAVAGADEQVRTRVRIVLDRHAERHLEHLVEPVGHFLVPIFFVVAGMHVRIDLFFDPKIVSLALGLTFVAIVGKVIAGSAAGRVNRWLVGWSMVPRGEVGLIFAFVGKSLGVVSDSVFSVIVLMVVMTTLVTPPVLSYLLRGERPSSDRVSRAAGDIR